MSRHPSHLASAPAQGIAVQGMVNGLQCPILLCEVCHTRITDARLAWAYFRNGLVAGDLSAVAFVHKHPHSCLDVYEAQGGRRLGTQEVVAFLLQLLSNVGIDASEVPRLDADLREQGW